MTKWTNFGKAIFGEAFSFFKFLCVLQCAHVHVGSFVYVYGPSMIPTFDPSGELLLAERFSVHRGKVRPGDIVLVQSPLNPNLIVTKRLIAMENERVTFIKDPKNSDKYSNIKVPKGHVWVQGDNIYNSMDSRGFGPVPYGLLKGRIFWRLLPTKDFGPLKTAVRGET